MLISRICPVVCATICLLTGYIRANAQLSGDSLGLQKKADTSWRNQRVKNTGSFPYAKVTLPAVMVAYGFIALGSDDLQNLDKSTQEEIWDDHPHKHIRIDNYLQFAPAGIVYALNMSGIKGQHDLLDRSAIYGLSNVFLNLTVRYLKNATQQERPDGSNTQSFPSGHTAEAFASAEFLRMEYRHKSPWYGIGGYAIAALTGYMRMYNNKHYVSDVIAGAGIGIISTDLSYWLYPKIKKVFVKHDLKQTMVLPFYQNKAVGLCLTYNLP